MPAGNEVAQRYSGDGDVQFKSTDPVTGSTRQTNADGEFSGNEEQTRHEIAGLGTYVPHNQIYAPPPPSYMEGASATNPENGCEFDGMPLPCTISRMITRWDEERSRVRGRGDGDYPTPVYVGTYKPGPFPDDYVFADDVNYKRNRKGLYRQSIANATEGYRHEWVVEPGFGSSPSASSRSHDCSIQAFLDALAWAEGADYDTVVRGKVTSAPKYPNLVGKTNVSIPLTVSPAGWGGIRINYPTDHPNIKVYVGIFQGKRTYSTAAGRYQIIKGTWDKLGYSGRDFSPQNQDAAAIDLLSSVGAVESLQSGDLDKAVSQASGQWASLPGSTAGQGTRSMDAFKSIYLHAKTACDNGV